MVYLTMLEANKIYHFFNQGNNNEPIFFQERNYQYFINKATYHFGAVCDILA